MPTSEIFGNSLLFKKLKDLDGKYVELICSVYEEFEKSIEAIEDLFWDYTDHGIKAL